MRGAPQSGFSRLILRISLRISFDTGGRPVWPRRTFQVQNRRNPVRCQAMTVAGLTMRRAERHSAQAPQSQAHKHRSKRFSFGFFTERCSTPSRWRRARISSCDEARVRKTESEETNGYMQDFAEAPPKNKALHLRMLRSAIERSPEDLQLILREVIQLPVRKQEELARLLREASLSAIISAAKVVADRLKFLNGLEQIVFVPETKARLKERSQLHKIIADNTWVFGEEFNLSVNDQSLTEVLRQHRKTFGDDLVIDEPVKHISKPRGIADLILSPPLRRHRADEVDHLVVELKAPRRKFNTDEITQIEHYAISVAEDSRFRTANGIRWTFWVLSDDIGKLASSG